MKYKITQSGFEGYTGQIGMMFFENGVSVGEVSERDAVRVGGIMSIEREDGTVANPAQILLDGMDSAADFAKEANADQVIAAEKERANGVSEAQAVPTNADAAYPFGATPKYTEAELGEIADKGGIKALREIADGVGVKAQSVQALITGIVSKVKAEA